MADTQQSLIDTNEQHLITSRREMIPLDKIVLDKNIYPREEVNRKRAAEFVAIMRDGVEFPLIEVQEWEDLYRVLDGGHRFTAYKDLGREQVEVIVVNLDGTDPMLYAASKAIGPAQLKDDEAERVARECYERNPKLTSKEIGLAVGRSRQTIDDYISDLRAAIELALDLKILCMDRLGIPQERIAERLELKDNENVRLHLQEMPKLANLVNTDLARGFTVSTVAEKHGWPEPLVWSVALEGKTDMERFKALEWGLRTWDDWRYNDVDKRFGTDWPGRIPAQLVAHVLYFFTEQGNLIFDPMAGGGVTPDTCLAFNRRCWSFDLNPLPGRPEIEPHHWLLNSLAWPISSKAKPDLIFFDPPYYTKKEEDYAEGSISDLSKPEYLAFFRDFFSLCKEQAKKETRLAFLNADWRDFEGKSALEESPKNAITMLDYARLLEDAGWQITHLIDTPLSSERFNGNMVKHMQLRRELGVVRRTLIMARQD